MYNLHLRNLYTYAHFTAMHSRQSTLGSLSHVQLPAPSATVGVEARLSAMGPAAGAVD